ncbi:MAG: hypothetical protein HUU35_20280 [Armatimonadetes bacterium]|nr:hypothetical protein [Armatimonadota bacterium]
MDEGFPTARLVATASVVRAGAPLPLELEVSNQTDEALRDAMAEVTLEVERGVLVTWHLSLREVAAGEHARDAVRTSEPGWTLPLNVSSGLGHFRVVLLSADGAWLSEHELVLPVEA